MTPKTHQRRAEAAAMQFLIEEFIAVGDGDETAIASLQKESARALLPGPRKGPVSPQQAGLMGMQPAEFQVLRGKVRDWLRSLATYSTVGQKVRLKGPLDLWLVAVPGKPDHLRAPVVEGAALDVFWFYVVNLVSRVGLSQIAVCRAPKSKRDPGQQDPELAGETEPCERLYLRRGNAKKFCSDLCRARVATQRARGGSDDAGARRANTTRTQRKVKR